MPFTVAHPAAVLPLLRLTRGRGVVPAALVVGSMVPDLPYFAPVPLVRSDTHALASVPGVDLLLGLVVYALWQGLLAPAAVALAPAAVRGRLPAGCPRPLRDDVRSPARAVAVVLSLVAGTVTHLAWDALTHDGRWGSEHLGILRERLGPLLGVQWVQHVSTLVGLAVLTVWLVRWWRRTPPRPDRTRPRPVGGRGRAVAVAAVVGPAAPAAAVAAAGALLLPDPALERAAFLAVTTGGSVSLAAACAVAVVLRLRPSPCGGGREAAAG